MPHSDVKRRDARGNLSGSPRNAARPGPAFPIDWSSLTRFPIAERYYAQYHPMTKAGKLVERMRSRPRDWRMESLEVVARHYGITVRKTGGSHFVFLHAQSEIAVSIPFRRPIKPIYVSQFLALIDDIEARK